MKRIKVNLLFLFIFISLLTGCGHSEEKREILKSADVTYQMTDVTVSNPFIGFAIPATYETLPQDHSLVYIDITFAELQPDGPDTFNFDVIAKENQIERWKKEGKHAVLRFICDIPGSEMHLDIPMWLFELTEDGDFYDNEYGKGYAPNYANEVFIYYHQKAIKALGEYFSDGFLRYVKIGSLGHWGEWHVLYSSGIQRLPDRNIREQYVRHYIDAFSNANMKLLMRRPFEPAAKYGLGLFNDMTGDVESTEEWLDWIENGGTFTQTQETNALVAMSEFWKTAPVGGEFTSSIPMEQMCGINLKETLTLLERSHTSFLGPKCPVGEIYDEHIYQKAVPQILNAMGYRLGIVRVRIDAENGRLLMQWANSGNAPIYFDMPVRLYLVDSLNMKTQIAEVEIDLTTLLPGETAETITELPLDMSYENQVLAIGIVDPETGKPAVSLVSNQKQLDERLFVLYEFT